MFKLTQDFYFIFRDKATKTDLLSDLCNLSSYLHTNYQQDKTCETFVETFYSKYYPKLVKETKPTLHRTRSTTKRELKDEIVNSFGKGEIPSDYDNDTSTNEKCLEKIKVFENNIAHRKREIVFYIHKIGLILKQLKSSAPKDCGIGMYLNMNGIKYSDSYCRNLILVYELIEKHQNLLKCSLNVRTFIQKRKIIEEICCELSW